MRGSVALKQNAPRAGRFASGINVHISRKRRYGRIATARVGIRMLLLDHGCDFPNLMLGNVHHHEDFSVLYICGEFFKAGIGHIRSDHPRGPDADDGANQAHRQNHAETEDDVLIRARLMYYSGSFINRLVTC